MSDMVKITVAPSRLRTRVDASHGKNNATDERNTAHAAAGATG